ncbi:MAG: membrane protein insertase YidC [Rickettsiales bacterium]
MKDISQNTRLIIACIISTVIIAVWQYLFVEPMIETQQQDNSTITQTITPVEVHKFIARSEAIAKTDRIAFENKVVKGSVNLVGARFDDLILKKYHVGLDAMSPQVELLNPLGTTASNFIEFGWVRGGDETIELPTIKTKWQVYKSGDLSKEKPLVLVWKNSSGQEFYLSATLDENYMFSISQKMVNNGKEVALAPYSLVSKNHTSTEPKNMIIHEGGIAVAQDKLDEVDLETLKEDGKAEVKSNVSWMGFSDKYWLSAIIPADKNSKLEFKYVENKEGIDRFQANLLAPLVTVNGGGVFESSYHLFVGAKELDLLDKYEQDMKIKLFDRAVDFGVLYFITKPIFMMLHYFYDYLGNFGVAILMLTVLIKLILFPLAHKGFVGMNKMKDLQPKMAQLKERYAEDASGFQKALLELYKKEKVNPMAGCLPILLQIPVFFALYKVLYVTIEMRHAPFFGWIKDLSVPDPTSIFNLFGLIPWDPPSFLMVGVFPILMALTMYFQQRLNPEPTDPVQAQVMRLLPLIFLFMFASFPSGLVIYWAWSNVLSILQQLLIKRMVKVGK